MLAFFLFLFGLCSIHDTHQDQSIAILSDFGYTFVPIDSTVSPFLSLTQGTILHCHMECNEQIACRTFDFDQNTGQCRLWSDDLTTGMISLVVSSKPRSKVGSIQLTSNTYASTHNQPCDRCAQSRYEVCDPVSSTCQCPSMTFWNGSMCLPQRYMNQSCATPDSCRPNRNLECRNTECNSIYQCLNQTIGGVTVAGFCNATIGGGTQGLSGPWGLYVTSNNTLYVADYDVGRVQAYSSFSRYGVTIMTTTGHVDDLFVDSMWHVYTAVPTYSQVFVSPANTSLPISVSSSCTLSAMYQPYGVAVDSYGNIYISDYSCHVVMKWTSNTTTGILVAGQLNTAGNSSQLLSSPKCIFLDEVQSTLYVVDYGNNRIQKFVLGTKGTGITVAGGYGFGSGLNQLKNPVGIWVSRKDRSIYVGDQNNHRVMKWSVNATQGVIIAGVTGVTGSTSLLLNTPGDVALDPTESFIYVADYGNHRVQRFLL